MKTLLLILFLFLQIVCFSQTNIITELWITTQTVPIVTISNQHEMLFYDNDNNGVYDLLVKFTPTNTQVDYLLYYLKTGTVCIIKLKVNGQTLSTNGTVDFIRQSGIIYEVNFKGVILLKPY